MARQLNLYVSDESYAALEMISKGDSEYCPMCSTHRPLGKTFNPKKISTLAREMLEEQIALYLKTKF